MSEAVPVINVDFQNADKNGRVWRNTIAALEYLARLPRAQADGTRVRLVDAELSATGVVQFDAETGLWAAVVDSDGILDSSI